MLTGCSENLIPIELEQFFKKIVAFHPLIELEISLDAKFLEWRKRKDDLDELKEESILLRELIKKLIFPIGIRTYKKFYNDIVIADGSAACYYSLLENPKYLPLISLFKQYESRFDELIKYHLKYTRSNRNILISEVFEIKTYPLESTEILKLKKPQQQSHTRRMTFYDSLCWLYPPKLVKNHFDPRVVELAKLFIETNPNAKYVRILRDHNGSFCRQVEINEKSGESGITAVLCPNRYGYDVKIIIDYFELPFNVDTVRTPAQERTILRKHAILKYDLGAEHVLQMAEQQDPNQMDKLTNDLSRLSISAPSSSSESVSEQSNHSEALSILVDNVLKKYKQKLPKKSIFSFSKSKSCDSSGLEIAKRLDNLFRALKSPDITYCKLDKARILYAYIIYCQSCLAGKERSESPTPIDILLDEYKGDLIQLDKGIYTGLYSDITLQSVLYRQCNEIASNLLESEALKKPRKTKRSR